MTKGYSILANYRYIFSEISKTDPIIFLYLFALTLGMTGKPLALVFLPKIILEGLAGNKNMQELFSNLAVLLGIWLLSEIIYVFCNNRVSVKLMRFRTSLLLKAGQKSMQIPFAQTENPQTLNALHIARTAVQNSQVGVQPFASYLFQFSPAIVYMAVTLTYLLILDVWLFCGFLLLAPIVYFSNRYLQKKSFALMEETAEANRKKEYFHENVMIDFEYGKDIRLSKMKHFLLNQLSSINKELLVKNKKEQNRETGILVLQIFVNHALEAVFYLYLIYMVFQGRLDIPLFGFYTALLLGYSIQVSAFCKTISNMSKDNQHINSFRNFINMEFPEFSGTIKAETNFVFETLEFKNVSFKYPGQTDYVLKDINVMITGGKKIALVGRNGAGKSTFIKLLCRMYEPNCGEILLNGININKYSFTEYIKLISCVFQDVYTYPFTLAENITMSQNIDKERLGETLKSSGLFEKVQSLPKSTETFIQKGITDDSVQLSGGEEQKIAIARAVYKNAPVFILDEPTSALDPFAEIAFYNDFNNLSAGKCSFFISHRLASTAFCDYIYVFDKGEIAEQGTKEELLRLNSLYAKMFTLQAELYEKAGA